MCALIATVNNGRNSHNKSEKSETGKNLIYENRMWMACLRSVHDEFMTNNKGENPPRTQRREKIDDI